MIIPWNRGIDPQVASTYQVLMETLEELRQRSTCCCETGMLGRQDSSVAVAIEILNILNLFGVESVELTDSGLHPECSTDMSCFVEILPSHRGFTFGHSRDVSVFGCRTFLLH